MTDEQLRSITSPLDIFANADALVQGVILLLAFASIVSWTLIINRYWSIAAERRRVRSVRRSLGDVSTRWDLRQLIEQSDGRIITILSAIDDEWRSAAEGWSGAYENVRERLLSIAEIAVARESRLLTGRTSWLATIGATAPFVGLFGTVWGIMASFIAIGQSQDTSLAVVAPGIAEALLATAVGLFCAIPAVIGYNRLQQGLAEIDAEWRSTAGLLEIAISHHFDSQVTS